MRKVVIVCDIDKTLASETMEDPIISDAGIDPSVYWTMVKENDNASRREDGSIAHMARNYIQPMIDLEEINLSADYLESLGPRLELFEGADSFFPKLREWGKEHNIEFKYYLCSTGFQETAEALPFAKEMDGIYGTQLAYGSDGIATDIAYALDPEEKPEVVKQIENIENIETSQIIYLGDGITDAYVFEHVSENGGHSICVYPQDRPDKKEKFDNQDFGDVRLEANYSDVIPQYIQNYVLDG